MNSETYQTLKFYIENHLLVIRHKDLVSVLGDFQGQGKISEQENQSLLSLADHLKAYN